MGASRSMTFGIALAALKNGRTVTRAGWNGRDMWIGLQRPEHSSAGTMTLPFLFMRTAHGGMVPWVASQTDLLAEDWSIVS
jgi:hypothetical protein